ncbi:MAG: nuclease-related domain-containing protein [Solirubrobacteraceae bacterium]
MSASESRELDTGAAGASARREHERRRANRQQAVREKHPRTAALRLALASDPSHEMVWARGAAGEERVAAILAKHLHAGVVVLHDRRIPGTRANIDHIAVAPSGVWVIDAKRYKGKLAVSRPLFGKAKLMINGRDRSTLIDGLTKQVALVQEALAIHAPGVEVHGALCFIDTELPLLGTLGFGGYPLLRAKALAKRLNTAGDIDGEHARALAAIVSERFPAA